VIRWPLFDFIADLIGDFWRSWMCWGLGTHRNATQRIEAQWLDLTGARG
jgi:hypothetical protein